MTYAVLPTVEVEKDPDFTTYARLIAKKMDERGFKESNAKTVTLGVYLGFRHFGDTTSTAAIHTFWEEEIKSLRNAK